MAASISFVVGWDQHAGPLKVSHWRSEEFKSFVESCGESPRGLCVVVGVNLREQMNAHVA
jgi:hypothetical protein